MNKKIITNQWSIKLHERKIVISILILLWINICNEVCRFFLSKTINMIIIEAFIELLTF